MRKILWLSAFGLAVVLSAVGYFAPWEKMVKSKNNDDLWKTDRIQPDDIALNAYLSANAARQKYDLTTALKNYQTVLQKDPQNIPLIQDVYMLSMIQGRAEFAAPYTTEIDAKNQSRYMSDYFRTVQLIQNKSWDLAIQTLNHKSKHAVDELLRPLLLSWIYAGQRDLDHAVQALDPLKNKATYSYLLGYQMVLLGVYLQNTPLIQQGIQSIQNKKIPAIGYFPLIKKYANPTQLNEQFQKMQMLYPATADLIQNLGQSDLTLDKAMAEMIYLVSAESGNALISKEEAVFLNSIALYLQPDKQLSLVWGAELTESLSLPKIAVDYYERIQQKSATLLFKQAAALVLANQTEKAIPLIKRLEPHNYDSIPLLTLMAQIYQEGGENESALKTYNHLIFLLEKQSQNQPLSRAYVARANLYHALKQTELMLSDLRRAQQLDPENAMLQNDLGYHQLTIGNIDEGFSLVEQAFKQRPDDPYILDSMAYAYYQKQQYATALPLAEKSLDLMPQSALINAHLGDIYTALGRQREAQFQYKKALDLKTDLDADLEKELENKVSKRN